MELSLLHKLLKNEITVDSFKNSIEREIHQLKKK